MPHIRTDQRHVTSHRDRYAKMITLCAIGGGQPLHLPPGVRTASVAFKHVRRITMRRANERQVARH